MHYPSNSQALAHCIPVGTIRQSLTAWVTGCRHVCAVLLGDCRSAHSRLFWLILWLHLFSSNTAQDITPNSVQKLIVKGPCLLTPGVYD